MHRARRGKRSGESRRSRRPKRHKPESSDQLETTIGSESARESGGEGMVTPPRGISSVDVGEVSASMSRLALDDEECCGRVPVETSSPKSRKKGTLKRRTLIGGGRPPAICGPWSVRELKALVLYLLEVTDGSKWISRKADEEFWEAAAEFVQQNSSSSHRRTG